MSEPGEQSNQRAWSALTLMLDGATIRRLEALGVAPGWRCLEVGAGVGSIAAWLGERVGAAGRVLATDRTTELLDGVARANVEVLQHDVTTEEFPAGEFDLVHARWVIHWLPQPELALERMVRALRPGGWLLVEEPDFVTCLHGASSQALARVMASAVDVGAKAKGIDNFLGRRLPQMLQRLDLADRGEEGCVPTIRGGAPASGAEWLQISLRWLEAPLVAQGRVSRPDFAEALACLDDPGFTTLGPLTMAVWGRRPQHP